MEPAPHNPHFATSVLCVPGGDWRDKRATVRDAVGSVLNQLSQNGDVTRLSLPAVFQYPYSALELGAYRGLRFVNQLIDVKQEKDPLVRLVQVLAWANTSAENAEFNKKPYNPVLGEELLAWVDDGGAGVDAKYGRTVFRAEQCEHHPPVSCFVMRNDKHDLRFTCNVQFAVAFHGNSITISTRGFGEIELGKETYAISKYIPDLRIESCVFGTRRQVWSGQWELSCPQTGLVAKLNFSETKHKGGWFSGSTTFVNEVSGFVAKISDPTQTPLASISGIAGEKLTLHRAGKPDLILLDFSELKDKELPLRFLPTNMQPPNDSLRVWRKVTKYILQDNLRKADAAKIRVEENARKLRKDREAQKTEYKCKYFEKDAASDRWTPTEAALALDEMTSTCISSMTSTTLEDYTTEYTSQTRTEFTDSGEE